MDLRKRCRPGERVVHAIFLLLALIVAAPRVRAQPPPTISRVRIVGNQRVEEDAIRIHISAQPGQPLNDAVHAADLERAPADSARQGLRLQDDDRVQERRAQSI